MIGGGLMEICFSPFLDFGYHYDGSFNFFMCMIYGKAMRKQKKSIFRDRQTWEQRIKTRNREYRSRPEEMEVEE